MSRATLTCVVLSIIFAPCFSSRVVVDSGVGRIVGTKGESFTSFLGIPYGQVNEDNPFAKSMPHDYFAREFEATQDPPICPQLVKGQPQGSLDCLRLNIYTPNNKTKPLPVIIFLHGGGWVEGDGNLNTYSPKFLVAKDVIVVTINYRLGIYGFLCLEDVSFNHQGLEDQKLGLKWVKDNIKDFGGDSQNLVLSGHSAGSVSAGYHLLFENQYFDKVILQSGMFLSPISEPNGVMSNKIVERLGFNVTNQNASEIIEFLKRFDVHDLVKLTSNETYKMCLNDTYLEHHKLERLKDVKILVGLTDKEAGYFFANPNMGISYKNVMVSDVLKTGMVAVDDNMIGEVDEFYMKETGHESERDNFIDFATDFSFGYPVEQSIALYLKNKATVYRYIFLYDGGRNYMKLRENITYPGTVHGDELGYLFDMEMFGQGMSDDDAAMVDVITTLWTNFAKNRSLEYEGVTFPKTNMESMPYIILNGTQTRSDNYPFKKRMVFWDRFYKKHGKSSKSFPLMNGLLKYEAEYAQSSGSFNALSFTATCFIVIVYCLKEYCGVDL